MKKIEVLEKLNANPKIGLTNELANKIRIESGFNELEETKKTPLILKFLKQFKDILIIILIIAAILPLLIDPHDFVESIIIMVVVLVNAILGTYQENKAEKSLEALKKMSTPLAKVKRDGQFYEIESRLLVPGDIVEIDAGDFIPADCLVLSQANLHVDESALTGESVSVNKNSEDLEDEEDLPLGDRKNMLFASTYATYGKGEAIVVKTGMNTEIGKIAKMLSVPKEALTPLQVKLNQIGKVIGIIAIAICVLVFFFEVIATAKLLEVSIFKIGSSAYFEAFKNSVALAVAAIPEGLSTVVTVVLAIGVSNMAKRNAIVKKLPAVETLGSTSIVCSDKTGTLTQNKMTVIKLYTNELKDVHDELNFTEKELLKFFAICTDASVNFIDGEEKRIGDPTETALIDGYFNYCNEGKGDLKLQFPRLEELPFDSERKMMTVIVNYKGKFLSITKGAPDVVLNRSVNTNKNEFLRINEKLGEKALRVLGLGIKYLDKVPTEITSKNLENDLTFVGLVGMIDPSRPEVKNAIKVAKEAGIRTIMITGDHVVTAKAIAIELGIMEEGSLAITSADLQKMTDEYLSENIEKYSVYARVAPSDKVRIVEAWQKRDMVVAMTGDGVNDSPALKTADIGCAMGITGTDVAKEAAAMILTDDNFATIIDAVKEGRGIYNNIKKTVQYLLASNIGEVITIFVASIISIFRPEFGLPLLAIHLLWINLITDSLPAFALGMEKISEGLMDDKPRPKKEGFFANGLGITILWQGLVIGSLTLFAYMLGHYGWLGVRMDDSVAITMAFITLATIQLFHAFSLKSTKSVFSKQIFNNKYLWGAFFGGIGLQMLIMYIPALATLFKINGLLFNELLISFALAFSLVLIVEITKLFKKNKNKNKHFN